VLLAIAACATHDPTARQAGPTCRYDGLAFDADFSAGRLNGCLRTGDAYTLFIRPEDEPINPSPWYAFRVVSERVRTLTLTLDYGETRHRYAPVTGGDGGWRPLQTEVRLSDADTRATFSLEVPAGTVTIAGQRILTPSDEAAWVTAIAADSVLRAGVLGRSAEGRAIPVLEYRTGQRGSVVLAGRQHPPELTGAYALHAFVERLAEDDPLARRFRDRFALVVVPMLNPDGVARGHWRHDSAGTDLNRDWGAFARPEPRLLRDAMAELAESGAPPVLVLDFHSTWRDVLYTQPDDAAGARPAFAGAWHAAINARLDGAGIERGADHNPGKPTLKTWAHETYAIPAITYEVADDTPVAQIRRAAVIAAEEMMRLLADALLDS
jgi:predicted deacylase